MTTTTIVAEYHAALNALNALPTFGTSVATYDALLRAVAEARAKVDGLSTPPVATPLSPLSTPRVARMSHPDGHTKQMISNYVTEKCRNLWPIPEHVVALINSDRFLFAQMSDRFVIELPYHNA